MATIKACIAAAAVGAVASAAADVRRTRPSKYITTAKRVEGKLNVHLIPHTHDDVGWLKTVDQYYLGANNTIQDATVQTIIDAVVTSLAEDPNRRFIYVEQAFFQRWWGERPQYHDLVQRLVASGQLEFINGGACMHDEAGPTAVDMIDQTTLGHRWLRETFGVAPKTTWQIDPFGHTAFQGAMMSSPLAGFNGVYFARGDYQEMAMRFADKTGEFFWTPSPSLGRTAGTLGGLAFYYYYPPPADAIPLNDDPDLEDNNIAERVETFIQTALVQANATLGDDLMWMLGTDFSYANAPFWYVNMDKLIHYVNLDGRVNALYSTPSYYTEAKIAKNALPVKTDDMMPYCDGPHACWTGYFTSRPALKGYVRDCSNHQQAARQLQFMTGGATDTGPSNPLYLLEQAMGVAQHHDAVSGTEKQHVAYDYARRLARGRLAADVLVTSAFQALTGDASATFVGCDLANVTICPALEAGKSSVVVVFNPQSHNRTNVLLRFPVGTPAGVTSYAVYDAAGNAVTAQMLPVSPTDTHLRQEYYAYVGGPVSWLAFTGNLPPMGYSTFFIVPSASFDDTPFTVPSKVRTINVGADADATITNGIVTLTFSGTTGLLTTFSKSGAGSVPLSQTFGWYNSSTGVNDNIGDDYQPSGAYIFRPNSSTVFPVGTGSATLQVLQGPVVQEARQTFDTWLSQIVRVVAGEGVAEFEWTVGPIPIQDGLGKEVISKYTTNFSSQATWYTDSNTRDTMVRIRNHRSYPINLTEPVSQNYVPVNGFTYIKDAASGRVLNVMVDRTQGGSSMNDGELELMVHRRLLMDDNRGVAEPLNETGLDGNGLIIRGIHRISIDGTTTAGRLRRIELANLLSPPVFNAAPLAVPPQSWIASHNAQMSALTAALPPQLHLFTVHSWAPKQLLVRVSHQYEVGEDPIGSQNATVALGALFQNVKIVAVQEMTLTANQPLASAPQTKYVAQDGGVSILPIVPPAPNAPDFAVTLLPMQIRTFMCTLA